MAANPRAASVKLRAVERIDQQDHGIRGRPRTAPNVYNAGGQGRLRPGEREEGEGEERERASAPRSGGRTADRSVDEPDAATRRAQSRGCGRSREARPGGHGASRCERRAPSRSDTRRSGMRGDDGAVGRRPARDAGTPVDAHIAIVRAKTARHRSLRVNTSDNESRASQTRAAGPCGPGAQHSSERAKARETKASRQARHAASGQGA